MDGTVTVALSAMLLVNGVFLVVVAWAVTTGQRRDRRRIARCIDRIWKEVNKLKPAEQLEREEKERRNIETSNWVIHTRDHGW
jgi:hypothetical protein